MRRGAGRFFGGILARCASNPGPLLFLAGACCTIRAKGRSSDNTRWRSARMAENVAGAAALDAYESELMLG